MSSSLLMRHSVLSGGAVSFPLDFTDNTYNADFFDIADWLTVRGTPSRATGPSGNGTVPDTGTHFWYGGNVAWTTSYREQALPASAFAAIDADEITLSVDHRYAGDRNDKGSVSLSAIDGSGTVISTYIQDTANSPDSPVWQSRNTELKLPAGTRTMGLQIDQNRDFGTSNDYYIDTIVTRLEKSDPVTKVQMPVKNCDASESSTYWTTTIGGNSSGPSFEIRQPRLRSAMFYAGNTARSVFYQTVVIPSTALSSVGAGTATLNWQFWQYCAGTDSSRIYVEFYSDEAGTQFISDSIPSYTNATNSFWTRYDRSAAVPTNAKSVRYYMDFDRNQGTSNDGWLCAVSSWIDI